MPELCVEPQAHAPAIEAARQPVKFLSAGATFRRAGMLWALVPLLAFVFACAAGRGWPFHVGPHFPKAGKVFTKPTATTATLFVYAPDARTMWLETKFQVDEPGKQPPLQIAITHGGIVETSSANTRAGTAAGVLVGTVPLHLGEGINIVKMTLGDKEADPTAFFVSATRITQGIFNTGNLLCCVTLAAVAAASILAARALGANGLHGFCAAILIGFFLLTASATILSPFHLLVRETWAVVLIASALALGAVSARFLRNSPPLPLAPENTLHPLEAVALLVLVCPVFVMAIISPITRWDDLMYHGSRTGYWMQNASVLPFVSHNDRLSVFPFGGDLLFGCGTILSGSEMPGKFLVSLALPLTVFAMFALLRNAGVRRCVALGITAVFATTPSILTNGVGIKPDLWLVLMGVITLHWVLTARRGNPGVVPRIACCLAAAGMAAALAIKWTAAPLILFLPFALCVPDWRQHWRTRVLPAAAAFTVALALGGAGPILAFNLWTSHHPLGPKAMLASQHPDPGLHPVVVQLKRLPFVLFAPPYTSNDTVRDTVEGWGMALANAVGATAPLRLENERHGFGRFIPKIQEKADGFSLGWSFIFSGVLAGIYLFRRSADRDRRNTLLVISGFVALFIVAVVTQTRWQVRAGLPDRFLLPAFALGLIAIAAPVDRLVAGRKSLALGATVLLGLHALRYCALASMPFEVGWQNGWQAPAMAESGSDFNGLSRWLPPGRTILLFADQSSQDYPLFLAREGFANRVLPWGKAAYEPAAFDRALHQPGVDTVIFVSAEQIQLLWDPPLEARPFVADMDARTDFWRLPGTGNLVVYLRKD